MGRSDNKNFTDLLMRYDYELPQSFIAQNPISPRDAAKLLIYDRKSKKVTQDIFKNLTGYLPQKSVLVFNDTKVIPARLTAVKPTGGRVELLFIKKTDSMLVFLANKKLDLKLNLKVGNDILTVSSKKGKEYFFTPSFNIKDFEKILIKYGKTPLPPYIKRNTLSEKKLKNEYQSVFAKYNGSVAAPTASLHFTKNLIQKIKKSGHEIYFVTLHVNLGTFSPISEKNVENKTLHKEYFEISTITRTKLNRAKSDGKMIIAVGTTVARTLESSVGNNGKLTKLKGTTDLFIDENTKLKFVDSLVTNFHVPKSSLLMLVASFIGRTTLFKLYKIAKENNYRFFSFGDGMYIK